MGISGGFVCSAPLRNGSVLYRDRRTLAVPRMHGKTQKKQQTIASKNACLRQFKRVFEIYAKVTIEHYYGACYYVIMRQTLYNSQSLQAG